MQYKYIIPLLLSVLLLASLTTVVSAGSYDNMELVANTTSDGNGNFTFTDVTNGEYTIISINNQYSLMTNSYIWYTNTSTIEVEGSDYLIDPLISRLDTSVDVDSVLALLERNNISGTTFKKGRTTDTVINDTTIVLMSEAGEIVANTISDENGNFSLNEIPNGIYTLASFNELYSAMSKSYVWYTNTSHIEVSGSDVLVNPVISSKDTSVDIDSVLGLLGKNELSGVTFKKGRSADTVINDTTLVLMSDAGELIANTTSDANGNFIFSDISQGNYTLASLNNLYSAMSNGYVWYTNTSHIEVSGSDVLVNPVISSKDTSVDTDSVISLLERNDISGTTFKKGRTTNTVINDTMVFLLKEKASLYPPVANFSVDTSYGDCPLTVQFTDLSENATSWYWDFGDGTSSTEQNPAHAYDSVGFFNVKLTASNSEGNDTDRRINLITSTLPNSNRTKQILFLVIGDEETFMVKQAVEDMGMAGWVDVYGSGRENSVEILYTPFDENINMSKYDVVFITWKGGMSFLGADLEPQIHEMINETNPGTFVYDHNYDLEDFNNINYVNHTEHPYLEDYWMEQYDNNIVRLITYLSVFDLSRPFEDYTGAIRIEEPSMAPTNGIVHPDAGYEIFEDLGSYLEWYSDDSGTHHVYDPENYTVGITFFAGHDGDLCDGVTEGLITELESRGINVIPAFRPGTIYEMSDAELYFKADDEWKANAFIDIGMGVSSMSSSVFKTEALQTMNVPVINGIQYQGTIEEWEESVSGQDGRFQYQIPIMEIGGEIEAIVVGGKEYDEEMAVWTFQPIDYQMKWMVDRTVRWMDLQKTQNKDKKVAIIYYNHGKQGAMVAANLDVAPSIPNLLTAMEDNGYDLNGMQINRSEFIELVLQQGRNIGVWAPGELEYMVENYDVELLSVETYLEWFDELEPEARQSVIDTWGEAPGEGMVYENESGQYFVFPKIEVGNVLIAPQPPRGLTNNDAMLYHNQSIPPSHNYIAFYLWLNEEVEDGGYDTDAVVHFGRHGSQEWLEGKSVGLSAKECWPAILIQDMPVIYLYDVGGIGEGITAKRRGNAVMVDHLTAPIVNSGLYGNLTLLHDAMHNYEEAEGSLKIKHKESIIAYYEDLNLEYELGNSSEDLYAMENESFDNFILYGPVHDYLHEIADSYMPYGLHILGEDMSDEGLIAMVKSMLGNNFREHVNATGLCDDPDELSPAHSPNVLDNLLKDVLVNGTDPMDVVIEKFNIDYTSGQYYSDATADAAGEYNLSPVKEGKYAIYAFKEENDGWLTGKKYITVEDGGTFSEINIDLTKNLTGTKDPELENILKHLQEKTPFKMNGSGEIIGQTYYSPMGYPIYKEDVKVILQHDGEVIDVQLSDSTYNYTFTGIPDGEYDITALYHTDSDNWYLKTEHIEISSASSTSINIDFGMDKDNGAGEAFNALLGEISGICLDESLNTEPGCTVVLMRRMSDDQLTVVDDLYNAIKYADGIRASTNAEMESLIDALEGKYITPALGDDPTRSPDEVLPTGKNFYAFNPNIVPTKESWEMGKELVDEFLEEWKESHNGEYPEKVGFVLWSSESMRHKGVMESEIMYLLGVEPVWGSSGKVEGVKLIDEETLGRPRIDVAVTMTGVYRDSWKWQVQLMDRAVRLAAQAKSNSYDNYVKEHSDLIYDALMDTGNYGPIEATELSMCRLFGPDDGSWGVGGLTNAVDASGSWDNEEKLANLYIDSLGYVYGDNIWAFKDTELFRNVLADTEAVMFSRSGNSGRGSNSVVFDHTYEFFGGFGLAVRDISGYTPEMFIVNLKDPNQAVTETLGKFLAKDLRSQYWNPEYIKGMMEHGYTGASELDRMLEDFWGLNVMLPDEVTDEMWKEFYDVYIQDKYDLGMDEWFEQENPWAKQSMNARMLETIRKDYWDASDAVTQILVKDYVKSVVESGVTCCHHTCGNPLLDDFVQGNMGAAGISQQTQDAYNKKLNDATLRESTPEQQTETTSSSRSKSSSSTGADLKIVEPGSSSSNQTMISDSGAGLDADTPVQDSQNPAPDNYVEGYEMTKETVPNTDSSSNFSFTGSDIIASVLVLAVVGAMYVGFWKRRKL